MSVEHTVIFYDEVKELTKDDVREVIEVIDETPTMGKNESGRWQVLWENVKKIRDVVQRKLTRVALHIRRLEDDIYEAPGYSVSVTTVYAGWIPGYRLLVVLEGYLRFADEVSFYHFTYEVISTARSDLYDTIRKVLSR